MRQQRRLSPAVAGMLDAADEERIRHICHPQWIKYPLADEILKRLEFLLAYPPRPRMPNLLLVGQTNNGKTVLVRHFTEKVEKREAADGGAHPSVAMLSLSASGEVRHFYNAILHKLGAIYKMSGGVSQLEFQIVALIREMGVRMLIIDELQEVMRGGPRRQRAILSAIKHLANETQISIVGVGTPDVLHAVQVDAQMANRFRPMILRRWELDVDYLRFLATLEALLPLRRESDLAAQPLAGKVWEMSEGLIGEIVNLLTEAACLAITRGEERISAEVLDAVDWAPPSERHGGGELGDG